MAIIYGLPDSEKQLLDMYPKSVKKIEDIDKVHQELKEELESHPDKGLVSKIQKWSKQRQVNRFEKNKDDPFHAGAGGEIEALEKLSKLSDDYHIFCGINAILPYFVRYNGHKNLRTAQLDFVVISKKGIILIEVKNWSNQYYNQHKDLSPHEQVDRAGRVLWIAIKSRWGGWFRSPKPPRITSVLLSIQGNMRYDPNYRFVSVSDLNKINYFIENKREELTEKDVKKLIKMLKDHVTK